MFLCSLTTHPIHSPPKQLVFHGLAIKHRHLVEGPCLPGSHTLMLRVTFAHQVSIRPIDVRGALLVFFVAVH